jgi:predicted transcriptional regulator
MTHRNILKRPLTDLQQALLDFIWARGSATAEDVRAGLAAKHPLKDSTVRTLLRRLEARGFLKHRVEGAVFVYSATVRPQSVSARAVQHIIERFWAGSAEQFLVGMVDEKVLSVDALRRLARKARKPAKR